MPFAGVNTDKLAYPFDAGMFPLVDDSPFSRVWTFPPGPVNMELTCPGCGGFPFEFRDGMPSGRMKIRDSEDSRFLKLVDWTAIKTEPEIIERLDAAEMKPALSMSARFKSAKANDPWTGTRCGCTKKRKDFFDADMGWCKPCRREKLKKR
jgi:hypothetical protein